MVDVEAIVTGSLSVNCYLVAGPDGEALAIDPGDDAERIAARVAERDLGLLGILLTHAHDDHVGAVAALAEGTGASVHMHSADASVLRWASMTRVATRGEPPIPTPAVDIDLAGRSRLRLGALEVGILHTPGHTRGSVCFEIAGELFTGDTLLAEHVGRTDLREGDRDALESSLRLLAERYPRRTTIRPGHGKPACLGDVLARVAALPELR